MVSGETQSGSANTLIAGFLGLRAELKTNRRAQIGASIIAALFALLALFQISDAVDSMRGNYAEQALRLDRTGDIGSEKDWPERAASSRAIRDSYERRLWVAESEGVAAANLSDWVTNAAREAGLSKLQIKVDITRSKGLPADYRRLTATLVSQENEAGLYQFLGRIEDAAQLIVIDHLQVQQIPTSRLEATLVAYARIRPLVAAPK